MVLILNKFFAYKFIQLNKKNSGTYNTRIRCVTLTLYPKITIQGLYEMIFVTKNNSLMKILFYLNNKRSNTIFNCKQLFLFNWGKSRANRLTTENH